MARSTSADAQAQIRTTDRFYRPELDVLRFVAFLGVFFFHLKPHFVSPESIAHANGSAQALLLRLCRDVFSAGAFGVDLFFVLSAYLITELLLREKAKLGSLDVRAFYIRRILRIWPLYFFFIGLAWTLQFFVPGQVLGWHYVVAFLLMSGNWICAIHGLPASVALPLWSVSVEEQFYLLWPLVVRRASLRFMQVAAVGALIVATAVLFYLLSVHAGQSMFLYNTFIRFDGIALGIFVSLFLHGRIPSFSTGSRVLLGVFGVLGLLLASDLLDGLDSNLSPRFLSGLIAFPAAGVASVLVLLCFLGLPLQEWRLVRGLRLVYLGTISYGLYVYHYLALLLARKIIGALDARLYGPYIVLGLALTISLALVSYYVLERPFLHLKARFTHLPSRQE